jgi:hypothetical protein
VAAVAGVAGVVGVSAAVALPALAAERDETPAPSEVVAEAVTSTVPTSEELAQRELAGATPDQLNFLVWLSMDPGQRAFVEFTTAPEEQRNFIAFVSAPEDVRAAFVDALTPEPPPAPPAEESSGDDESTSSAPAVADGSVWDRLAQCESSGNWSMNSGNGFYGGLQFMASTWRSVGGTGLPHEHSREEQIYRAEILLARSGWGQWPACSAKLGLR